MGFMHAKIKEMSSVPDVGTELIFNKKMNTFGNRLS
jgi:hypothetical protein